MDVDKSPFYDNEIATYSFNISEVLVVARMYRLIDKVSPTGRFIGHIESKLKNYLAILILGYALAYIAAHYICGNNLDENIATVIGFRLT
jgi:hypothetical protein